MRYPGAGHVRIRPVTCISSNLCQYVPLAFLQDPSPTAEVIVTCLLCRKKNCRTESETVPYEAVGTLTKIPIGPMRVSALSAHELTRRLIGHTFGKQDTPCCNRQRSVLCACGER